MATDIFVSYAREDQSRVEPIIARLNQEGFQVYWDRKLEMGGVWIRELNAHLESAACVIVVWSSRSVNSAFVQGEAIKGFERNVLIPIAIEPDLRFPAPFSMLHTSEVGNEASWQKLIERIRGAVSTAQEKGRRPSATELEDKLKAEQATAKARIQPLVEPLRVVASSAEVGQTELAEQLQTIEGRLHQDDLFVIAVVGRMKVGKSTLLNALLGVTSEGEGSPLPTDDQPCTATLIKLRYSEKPYCRPYAWDREKNAVGAALPDWKFEDFKSRAQIYVEGQETNVFDNIAEFEVGWPSTLLRLGVTVIDTPGVSENPERTDLTRAAIAGVDAAIVTYRSEPFAGTDEIHFADYVTSRVGKVFTLINLRNTHVADEKFRRIVQTRLSLDSAKTMEQQEVYFSQLQNALAAKINRDGSKVEASGLTKFESRLGRFLQDDQYTTLQVKIAKEIRIPARQLLDSIRTLQAGAQADSRKLAETILACKEDLDRIRRKKGVIESLIANAQPLVEGAAIASFRTKVGSITTSLPGRIEALNLGLESVWDKIKAGTLQGSKYTDKAAEKIHNLAKSDIEAWASSESDKPGLAQDLKPHYDQLAISLNAQAEDIAEAVQRIRARVAALGARTSSSGDIIGEGERGLALIIGGLLLGPLGIVGLGGMRGIAGATGGIAAGAIGIALATTILHIAFPPTAVVTAIMSAFTVGGAILGTSLGLENRLKKKAWEKLEPSLRGLADSQTAHNQVRDAVRAAFAEFKAKSAEGLARIISGEQQTLAKLEEFSREQDVRASTIERLGQHERTVQDAIARTEALITELERPR